MRRTITTIGLALMMLVLIGSVIRVGQKLANGTTAGASASVAVPLAPIDPDGVQRVTLALDNGNYSPRVIHVRKDIPAEIVADLSRLRGCFTSFVVPDLNIWTQFTTTKDRIAFVPNRAGTFRFSCAMGMGNGTLIVDA